MYYFASSTSTHTESPTITDPRTLLALSVDFPAANIEVAALARSRNSDTKFSTPTKKPRINVLRARNLQHMKSVLSRSSLEIIESGAGISGVGKQWKMTDISRASTYIILGAFGEPMIPTAQGFLGPEKLSAVLVPGMKDDIYSNAPTRTPDHQGKKQYSRKIVQ